MFQIAEIKMGKAESSRYETKWRVPSAHSVHWKVEGGGAEKVTGDSLEDPYCMAD